VYYKKSYNVFLNILKTRINFYYSMDILEQVNIDDLSQQSIKQILNSSLMLFVINEIYLE
jgi:hypothetical protein